MDNLQIEQLTHTWGVDFYGIADLAPAYDFIRDQGGDWIAGFPLAISLGIRLLDPIVDQLPHRNERIYASNYRHHAYDVVNNRLDLAASHLGSLLQTFGFQALPVPASKRVDDERICAAFSHKLAAHLAGLGWIGKSCLLVTPEAGPRVRWATVLSDAPLSPTGSPMAERCGSCTACVDICPVQAFTGRPFREDEPREMRYEAAKCDCYFNALAAEDPNTDVCGLCLYICPYGRAAKSARNG